MSLDTSLKWLDALTKIGILVGGLWTALLYHNAKQTERVERTFDLVAAFTDGDIAKDRDAISSELRGQFPTLQQIRATSMPAGVAAEVHAKIVRGLVGDSRGGRGLAGEIDRLLDYFNQVEICVEKRLCDRDTAHAFLGSYARTLWINFRPYIETLRLSIPGYGIGLQRFVATAPREPAP